MLPPHANQAAPHRARAGVMRGDFNIRASGLVVVVVGVNALADAAFVVAVAVAVADVGDCILTLPLPAGNGC